MGFSGISTTGAGVAITAHHSLYPIDPTTDKCSTNSVSFLKLVYAKNIPHSELPVASAGQQ